jgi:hypothetical protein
MRILKSLEKKVVRRDDPAARRPAKVFEADV